MEQSKTFSEIQAWLDQEKPFKTQIVTSDNQN